MKTVTSKFPFSPFCTTSDAENQQQTVKSLLKSESVNLGFPVCI